jgi:hypothetical protein
MRELNLSSLSNIQREERHPGTVRCSASWRIKLYAEGLNRKTRDFAGELSASFVLHVQGALVGRGCCLVYAPAGSVECASGTRLILYQITSHRV